MSSPAVANALTPRRVPEAYLRAEVAAFPLVGERAFEDALVELDPALKPGEATAALWRACEGALVAHTGWSLDRLVAARDGHWFDQKAQQQGREQAPFRMHRYLRQLARAHLEERAGVTRLATADDASLLDLAGRYRWLVFALPEDLLLAALDVSPSAARVDLDPPLLVRRLLDRGVAEIHQHAGAGMDFPLLWTAALEAVLSPDLGDDALAGPGAPLGEGRWLVRWLLAAAVARVTLGEYLLRERRADRPRDVTESLRDAVEDAYRWTAGRRATWRDALRALAAGGGALPDIVELRSLYADLHPAADPTARPASLSEVHRRCDPLAARLGLSGHGAGERWLVTEGLAMLDRAPARLPQFERLFWQTMRVRCLVYRAVVERPLTAGLQWFVRFYDRIGPLRAPLDPSPVECALQVAAAGQPIHALELRSRAAATATGVGEDLLRYVRSYRRAVEGTAGASAAPEFGVVYHFIKRRDRSAWLRGAPPAWWGGTVAEPRSVDSAMTRTERGGRYLGFLHEQGAVARAIADLLWAFPDALHLLRGVDVAADELGAPTWTLVPLFQHVIGAGAAVAPVAKAPPLGVTAHVGEDFRHLMEGMRRIEEHLNYVLRRAPGRLGHAVALGVSPQAWAESVGAVTMPAEEHLWDLVWEWRLYSRHHALPELAASAPPGRVEHLRQAIRDHAVAVFGERYEPQDLAAVHHELHGFLLPSGPWGGAARGGLDVLERAYGFLEARGELPTASMRALHDLLFDEATFRRGQALVPVVVDAREVAALDAVQRALRRAVSDLGVVVEVNPSSNLLIGDMLDLRNHPVLRLRPPEPEEGAPPPVAIALGSDDPVTFSTRLTREYALLYDAARAAGYSEPCVVAWLDAVRQTSLDARFTVAWRPDPLSGARALERGLERYLRLPQWGEAPEGDR